MKTIITTMLAMIAFTGEVNATEVDSEELRCMAMNIYHESRGESITGQRAVAFVTLNRMEHSYFPDTICDVVWQHSQFAWTQDGLSDSIENAELYELAEEISISILSGEDVDDPTHGSLFFHMTNIHPNWANRMDPSVRIGVHQFYTWDGNWNND